MLEITSIALICLALLTIKYTVPSAEHALIDQRTTVAKVGVETRSDVMIDINLATVEELEAIPGVGKVIAQRIVDDRTAHGYFLAPADIIRVKGIGEKTYYKMLPVIKTNRKDLMLYLGY